VQEGRGTPTQIHCHVPRLSPNATYKLHFGIGRVLEVHSANSATARGAGVVDLGNRLLPPGSRQLLSAEQARQKASLIAKALAFNQFQASQG